MCPRSDSSLPEREPGQRRLAAARLGWAGWDHSEQAYALVTLIEERETIDGWESDHIRPLVEGLAEVMPWVRQWHNEVDPDGRNPADVYDVYLDDKRGKHGFGE